ncbi:hypothetical protein RRG08_049182 [Elysia crispata]|uniref:Uncharacterized protein n=1 Tax=Elysia crispata TaxID=231223 RepID=A0AAE1ARD3_9GAST|nr:hypothetical protein RRG08_049182 [Elysia crispata]
MSSLTLYVEVEQVVSLRSRLEPCHAPVRRLVSSGATETRDATAWQGEILKESIGPELLQLSDVPPQPALTGPNPTTRRSNRNRARDLLTIRAELYNLSSISGFMTSEKPFYMPNWHGLRNQSRIHLKSPSEELRDAQRTENSGRSKQRELWQSLRQVGTSTFYQSNTHGSHGALEPWFDTLHDTSITI